MTIMVGILLANSFGVTMILSAWYRKADGVSTACRAHAALPAALMLRCLPRSCCAACRDHAALLAALMLRCLPRSCCAACRAHAALPAALRVVLVPSVWFARPQDGRGASPTCMCCLAVVASCNPASGRPNADPGGSHDDAPMLPRGMQPAASPSPPRPLVPPACKPAASSCPPRPWLLPACSCGSTLSPTFSRHQPWRWSRPLGPPCWYSHRWRRTRRPRTLWQP